MTLQTPVIWRQTIHMHIFLCLSCWKFFNMIGSTLQAHITQYHHPTRTYDITFSIAQWSVGFTQRLHRIEDNDMRYYALTDVNHSVHISSAQKNRLRHRQVSEILNLFYQCKTTTCLATHIKRTKRLRYFSLELRLIGEMISEALVWVYLPCATQWALSGPAITDSAASDREVFAHVRAHCD